MNFLKKYFWVLFATMAILGIAILAAKICEGNKIPIWIEIEQDDNTEKVLAWYDAETKINYFFLPAYADDENAKVRTDDGLSVTTAGKSLVNGSNAFAFFEIDKEYEIATAGFWGNKYKVKFVVADNTSTMYINTVTGSMREVFKKKKHEEPASMAVYTKDGIKDTYVASMTINGRGNSTWEEEKKAFTLKLGEVTSILDLDGSSKWILLANAKDKSNLKNKIVYDLAKREGLPLTPDCEYTALYLNGEFYGLFLLCQSPNTAEERTDSSDEITLCKFEFPKRLETEKNAIIIGERNLPVECVIPKSIKQHNRDIISEKIETVDKIILNENTDIDELSEVIDIDSWTKKYLIDEIFENYDSGNGSAYFHWYSNSQDAKIYAGPMWDYDLSMGSRNAIKNPEVLFAVHSYRDPDKRRFWYPELYQNESFYKKVIELYENEFRNELEYITKEYIPNLADEIDKAVKCDAIRWKYSSEGLIDEIVEFLSTRESFLDSTWLENNKYCVVRGYVGGMEKDYFYQYVPYGKKISDCSYVSDYFTDDRYIPRIEETGVTFDVSQTITEDVNVVFEKKDLGIVEKYKSELFTNSYRIAPFTFALIVLMSIILLINERIKRSNK